jgi:hypothetical protein
MSLPPDERPRQRPVIKAEESGNVILASYPKLRPPPITPISIFSYPNYDSPIKTREAAVRNGILGNKTKISTAVIATVIAVVIALTLFYHYNHSPTTQSTTIKAPANVSATQMLSHNTLLLFRICKEF